MACRRPEGKGDPQFFAQLNGKRLKLGQLLDKKTILTLSAWFGKLSLTIIWGGSREKGHNVRATDFEIIAFKVHDVETDRMRRLHHVSIRISRLVVARLASGFHI